MLLSFVHAQNTNHIIKGNIFDTKSDRGIEFANITLYRTKDSTILTGSASGKNGEFIIPNIPAGKYFMKINFVGYKTRIVSNIKITDQQKEVTLGKIEVEESTILLNETEVVGKKQLEEYHLDKKVINISQDIGSIGQSALEAMQNLASTRTDAQGNLVIRGSSNFTVLIDGRPSVLSGSDALRQIPANIIDNIELITNPSAKYEAEGTSGIINIITKKKIESYLSSAVNLGIGTGTKRNGDVSINYGGEKFILSAGADYRKAHNPSEETIHRETYGISEPVTNNSLKNADGLREIYNFHLGMDYNFDKKNSLSLYGLLGSNKYSHEYQYQIHEFSSSSGTYSYVLNDFFTESKYKSAALNYSHKFAPKVNEITVEAQYSNFDLPSNDDVNDFISNSDYTLRAAEPKKRNLDNKSEVDRFRLKTNYSHKIDAINNFEAGFQADLFFKNMDITNKIFNWESHEWDVTRDITNKMNFRNNIYSAFAIYSGQFYHFDYQIGIRSELTDRLLEQKTMNREYNYYKLHLFPSFHILKTITAAQSLNFSYSRRITRPNETWLNPYITYSDSYNVNYGNPDLKPATSDSYELNYQTSFNELFLSIQTYLRSTHNSIYQVLSVDGQNRLAVTYDNFNNITNSGAELSANYTMFSMIQLLPSINLYNCSRNGKSNDTQINDNNFSWSAQLKTSFLLSKETQLQFVGTYFAKQFQQQLETAPIWNFTTALRQSLFEKRFTLTLQAQNLFKTFKYDMKMNGHNFGGYGTTTPEANIISLSLSYNFNNFKKSKNIPDVDIINNQ